METSYVLTDWLQSGFSCALWTDPPGQVWADFVHPADELLLPVEGEIELTVQGRTWRPALGEEMFIPAGALHTVRNVGGTTSRWWYGYRTPPPVATQRVTAHLTLLSALRQQSFGGCDAHSQCRGGGSGRSPHR